MTTTPSTTYTRFGPGVLGLLTIVFVLLKATGYLNWSWWLVFLPLYGPLALVAAVFILFGVVWLIATIVADRKDKKHQARRLRGR